MPEYIYKIDWNWSTVELIEVGRAENGNRYIVGTREYIADDVPSFLTKMKYLQASLARL